MIVHITLSRSRICFYAFHVGVCMRVCAHCVFECQRVRVYINARALFVLKKWNNEFYSVRIQIFRQRHNKIGSSSEYLHFQILKSSEFQSLILNSSNWCMSRAGGRRSFDPWCFSISCSFVRCYFCNIFRKSMRAFVERVQIFRLHVQSSLEHLNNYILLARMDKQL